LLKETDGFSIFHQFGHFLKLSEYRIDVLSVLLNVFGVIVELIIMRLGYFLMVLEIFLV
jgi:hypothetical protein